MNRLSCLWTVSLALAGAGVRAETCAQLTGTKLDHATVTQSQIVPKTGAIGGSAPAPDGRPLIAPVEFCRVQITSTPTRDSDIRIEVWIPSVAAWNHKFEQVGNGGFAGSLPYGSMYQGLATGYAVAGTDDGHQSGSMTDASWAPQHPEKVVDFGWRAIHDTAIDGRAVVHSLTAHEPAKSYFVGCSDGGREALMMAQRYPTYFDGILAGAPASSWTRLMASGALRSTELGGQPASFSKPQLALLQHEALQACGQGAGYLSNPLQCHVDVAALQCKGTAGGDSCLTAAQVRTAEVLYADIKDPSTGKTLYAVMPGAEAVDGSWDFWLTGNGSGPAAAFAFAWNHMAYLATKNPTLDLSKVTERDLARDDREYGPILNSDEADLAAFKAYGGKLIQYHGWNDPAIAPGYSLEYREHLKARMDTTDFYRLYMVPGMLHCGGGDAPTQVNWTGALEAWVEKGTAPNELTANGKGTTQILRPYD